MFARNTEKKLSRTLPISCQLAQDYPHSFPKQLQHPYVHIPSPEARGGGVELASVPFENLLNFKSKNGGRYRQKWRQNKEYVRQTSKELTSCEV